MQNLLKEIRQCKICATQLMLGPNPVMLASKHCKIINIGQAPVKTVHQTGISCNDKSGDNLRNWLRIDKIAFYNTDYFALMPMGFCFPGTGNWGDLTPSTVCAPLWHSKLLEL